MVRFYTRIGPNLGMSFGPWGWLLFWFCVLVGALPFIAVAVLILAAVWAFALVLAVLLLMNGIIFKAVTGRDAKVWVPGSVEGTKLEFWMEDKGWIRLPNSPKPLTHTQIMSSLYGDAGLRRKEINPKP